MPFLDETTVAMIRQAEHEWMMKAFHIGCPNCGQKLSDLPPEANIYPHQTGMCVSAEPAPKEEKS